MFVIRIAWMASIKALSGGLCLQRFRRGGNTQRPQYPSQVRGGACWSFHVPESPDWRRLRHERSFSWELARALPIVAIRMERVVIHRHALSWHTAILSRWDIQT